MEKMAKDFRNTIQHPTHKPINTEIINKISDINHNTVALTGLSHPVTEVKEQDQGYPRAYDLFPVVYENSYKHDSASDNAPEGQPDLYMFCPVGHDGDHFIPKDARLITDENEKEFISNTLFAGGWSTPFSYFTLNPRGVETPDTYVAPKKNPDDLKHGHQSQCFIAQGLTLELVEDYNQRTEQYNAGIHTVLKEIEHITSVELNDQFQAQLPAGEGYYMNSSTMTNDDGKAQYSISIRNNGNIDTMSAGQPLEIKSNDFFIAEQTDYSEHKITPNTATKQGQALAKTMDNVPEKPSLTDYPDLVADMPFKENKIDTLLNVNGNTPRIDTFDGHIILKYNTDDTTNTYFCPPDALPVPTEVFQWLQEDRADRQMGIRPPPQPEELKDDILALTPDDRLNGPDQDDDNNFGIPEL
ncbi:MAG: hypothetical protein COA45_06705 [Zetaproteobacteria bacterium]|nr:MAG: hypothetical protein COA45_06705 [Zetaproteobacteria bacterium]